MKQYNIPSIGGNALPTMDAAAISSGMSFLVSELEKFDSKLREPLTSTTKLNAIKRMYPKTSSRLFLTRCLWGLNTLMFNVAR